jgi:TolA-binding protein
MTARPLSAPLLFIALALRSLGEGGSLAAVPASAPDPAAAYRQAHAHLAAQRYREAAALFETAAATTNAQAAAAAWLGRGESLFGARQWEAAIAAYDTLLKTWPDGPHAPNALCARGFAEHQAGRLPQALATFTAFKTRYPDHALAPVCEASLEKIARALDSKAKQESVAEITRELAAINAAMREANYDQVRDAAARFLLAHPEHSQAADLGYLIALCDYRAKAYDRAAGAFRTFLDRYPQHARAALARGQLADSLLQAGRHDEASALYEELASEAADPEAEARATLALGDCRTAQQHWAEAERLYLSVEVLQGCDTLRPAALSRLADLYDKMGQPDKARRTREDLRRRYVN